MGKLISFTNNKEEIKNRLSLNKNEILVIKETENNRGCRITVNDKKINILDADTDYILAECSLKNLHGILSEPFPEGLVIQVHDKKGFGTFLFYEVELKSMDGKGLCAEFACNVPNKYWEGFWGLSTYLKAINDQIVKSDCFKVTNLELDDVWKQLNVSCYFSPTSEKTLDRMIIDAGHELKKLIEDAERVLKG